VNSRLRVQTLLESPRPLSLFDNTPSSSLNALRAVLIAPPGAGKGTQGERLAQLYRVPHISTGAILRRELASGSPTGAAIAKRIGDGELIPDRIVLSVMFEVISQAKRGFILDGFPRTLRQAIAAEQRSLFTNRPLDAAIEINVPGEELLARLARRGTVDESRHDDHRDVIEHRLEVYLSHSAQLLSYYRRRGILITIDGTGAVDEVTDCIRSRLDQIRYLSDIRPIER
jgi:adenylate kinase